MPGSIRWLVILALLLPFAAQAEVYKWKDAQGNLHFSDTPPPSDAQHPVQQVQLHADTGDFKVSHKVPIANPTPNSGATLGFDSFTLKLDNANGRDVTIGREFSGNNCEHSNEIVWNDGILNLKDRVAAQAVAARFRNFGYRFAEGDEAAGMADLQLQAQLLAMKFDVCSQIHTGHMIGPGSRGFVKVRWSLHHGADAQALFTGISVGSFDAWVAGGGIKSTMIKAIQSAADNLIGDQKFIDALSGVASSNVSTAPENVTVKLVYGNASGSFRSRSQTLLRSAITVRTPRGHGSGVLIDPAGFALTNAHVVGNDVRVSVMLDDDFVDARVVGRDRRADVALLEFDPHGHAAASIASAEPQPGDPLYVIGTPLSLKLSHSVTQGILSAKREIDGARLYQTDAAVNPGNSGGPVFDGNGDLVAITVSGIVNADGASVNVNYLIPIQRALTAMGIGTSK